jgi:hypothetical protein
MPTITTIGVDLAKKVFQVHGVDAEGRVVVARKLVPKQYDRRIIGKHLARRLDDVPKDRKGRDHFGQFAKHDLGSPGSAVIPVKNYSRCPRKNEHGISLISYGEPVVIPTGKWFMSIRVVPVTCLIVPESGKARQEVGVTVGVDPCIRRPQLCIIIGNRMRQWKLALPIA